MTSTSAHPVERRGPSPKTQLTDTLGDEPLLQMFACRHKAGMSEDWVSLVKLIRLDDLHLEQVHPYKKLNLSKGKNMAKSNRTGEAAMQPIVLRILDKMPNGEASIDQIISEVPKYVNLTTGDMAASKTREGEAMWEQIVRNIRSHADSPNNYIFKGFIEEVESGFKITQLGRTKVTP